MKNFLVSMLSCFFVITCVMGVYHYFVTIKYVDEKVNERTENIMKQNDLINNNYIEQIKTLESQLSTLEEKINTYDDIEKIHLITHDKANMFMTYFLNSDIEGMKKIVSNNIELNDKGFTYKDDNAIEIKYLTPDKYSFELNSYHYEEGKETITYFYRIYENKIPNSLIVIELKRNLEQWEVYRIDFDI